MVTTLGSRKNYTEQQRQEFLARYEQGDWTQMEFCSRSKLALSTFTLWRRAAKRAKRVRTAPPEFAQVQLSSPGPACAVTLHLPGGARLEVTAGTDAMWLGLGLLLKNAQTG